MEYFRAMEWHCLLTFRITIANIIAAKQQNMYYGVFFDSLNRTMVY